jgi:hypothetical protein
MKYFWFLFVVLRTVHWIHAVPCNHEGIDGFELMICTGTSISRSYLNGVIAKSVELGTSVPADQFADLGIYIMELPRRYSQVWILLARKTTS